ncbi:hypothetical protein SCHPADRAFT_383547 [Schizopora paradoxa]|uniref:Uncharacterized protein n=1 Tax=Schizopora paradoxa TaxID=27342 RepID=A0A0H2RND2_9AGAM|nr:hypothetical protein SCHPADRAFT_383547 [Schizopora paradoxa]
MFFQIALYLFFGFLRVVMMSLSQKNAKTIWNAAITCASFAFRVASILYTLLRLLFGMEQTDMMVVQLATTAYKSTLALAASSQSYPAHLSPRAAAKMIGRQTLALVPLTTSLALSAWAHRAEIAATSASLVATAVELGCTVGCAVASLLWSTGYRLVSSTSSYVVNQAVSGVRMRVPMPL